MKAVHVNHRYAPYVGGSERYMQEVSEHLVALGHDVDLITSNAHDLEYFWDSSKQAIEGPSQENLNGVQVKRVAVDHVPGNRLLFHGSRRAMGELSRLPLPTTMFELASSRMPSLPGLGRTLKQSEPFDIVHAANLGLEGPAQTAHRAAARMDVPFVITPFIHLGRPGDSVARRYVSMPHQRKLLRRASSVIVMTRLEASFVESLGVDAANINITGVGIIPDEVTGGNSERFKEKFGLTGRVVGVASAVAFDKGSRELVLAVRNLRKAGHAVELVLAGPRLSHFDRWYSTISPEDRSGIHLPGFISPADKRDMLAAIDILAMPSRTESFGIAFLEGWANRKPVIAANAGAVPELVRHNENGKLVEFGDVDGLADAILEVLADDAMACRLGSNGYSLTEEKYTWRDVLGRVMTVYEHALGYPLRQRSNHG